MIASQLPPDQGSGIFFRKSQSLNPSHVVRCYTLNVYAAGSGLHSRRRGNRGIGRPLLCHDARRLRRGCHQDRTQKGGRPIQSMGPPFCGQQSAYFLAANRNKRSLTLDFDHPFGKDVMHRLLETTDVFLTNQPKLDSLKRNSLDPESLGTRLPRLICCAISGYGLFGPKAGVAGYDIIAQAETGIMSFTGEPDGGPVRYPVALADLICGIYAALGILAALFARRKLDAANFWIWLSSIRN